MSILPAPTSADLPAKPADAVVAEGNKRASFLALQQQDGSGGLQEQLASLRLSRQFSSESSSAAADSASESSAPASGAGTSAGGNQRESAVNLLKQRQAQAANRQQRSLSQAQAHNKAVREQEEAAQQQQQQEIMQQQLALQQQVSVFDGCFVAHGGPSGVLTNRLFGCSAPAI